jgi:lipopolysaccharide/colanic/teichoic acid biosynthesis glycosyltransferase
MLKFRTMVHGAESGSGPVLSERGDPRVTPLGRFMRRFRLDEAPQLWNVLTGAMSLVGPRPERPAFVARFTETDPLYERRHLVRPGMTGLAQIHGRYDSDYAHKLRYDLMYVNSASFAMDLRILFATLRIVVTGSGAR